MSAQKIGVSAQKIGDFFKENSLLPENNFTGKTGKSGYGSGYKATYQNHIYMLKTLYKDNHNQHVDKQQYEWDRLNNVSEYVAADIFRKLALYSQTPEIALVQGSDSSVLYLRSKYLNDAVEFNYTYSHGIKNVKDFENVVAATNVIGDPDYNTGNVMAQLIDQVIDQKAYRAAKIDHGRSFTGILSYNFKTYIDDLYYKFMEFGHLDSVKDNTVTFDLSTYCERLKQISTQLTDDIINNTIDQKIATLKSLGVKGDFVYNYREPLILSLDELKEVFKSVLKNNVKVAKKIVKDLEIISKYNMPNNFYNGNWVEWLQDNMYESGYFDPIQLAMIKNITINGQNPFTWAIENDYVSYYTSECTQIKNHPIIEEQYKRCYLSSDNNKFTWKKENVQINKYCVVNEVRKISYKDLLKSKCEIDKPISDDFKIIPSDIHKIIDSFSDQLKNLPSFLYIAIENNDSKTFKELLMKSNNKIVLKDIHFGVVYETLSNKQSNDKLLENKLLLTIFYTKNNKTTENRKLYKMLSEIEKDKSLLALWLKKINQEKELSAQKDEDLEKLIFAAISQILINNPDSLSHSFFDSVNLLYTSEELNKYLPLLQKFLSDNQNHYYKFIPLIAHATTTTEELFDISELIINKKLELGYYLRCTNQTINKTLSLEQFTKLINNAINIDNPSACVDIFNNFSTTGPLDSKTFCKILSLTLNNDYTMKALFDAKQFLEDFKVNITPSDISDNSLSSDVIKIINQIFSLSDNKDTVSITNSFNLREETLNKILEIFNDTIELHPDDFMKFLQPTLLLEKNLSEGLFDALTKLIDTYGHKVLLTQKQINYLLLHYSQDKPAQNTLLKSLLEIQEVINPDNKDTDVEATGNIDQQQETSSIFDNCLIQ